MINYQVLAEGEALIPQSSDSRVAELSARDGPPPHKYPDVQLFTFKCRRVSINVYRSIICRVFYEVKKLLE